MDKEGKARTQKDYINAFTSGSLDEAKAITLALAVFCKVFQLLLSRVLSPLLTRFIAITFLSFHKPACIKSRLMEGEISAPWLVGVLVFGSGKM